MAKQTRETLAADLARRGGPKRPSLDERAAAARRVQANPGKPITYNDQQMRAMSAGRTGANNYRQSDPNRPAPIVPPTAAPRPMSAMSGPAFDVSFQPPPRPLSTYQAPQPYRPMTPTNAPGGLPGSAMPQQSDWRPPMQMGMDAGAWRPPMNNPPPSRGADNESLSSLFFSLGRMLGQAWHGTGGEEQGPPKPWLPDLWSLSGR